jgi:membrane protein implicated in regulation of membrane protease activity
VSHKGVGQLIITLGVILIIVGLAATRGWLSWFGRLPGDVRVERENMQLYVPIVSMILISILFSVLSYVIRRFF